MKYLLRYIPSNGALHKYGDTFVAKGREIGSKGKSLALFIAKDRRARFILLGVLGLLILALMLNRGAVRGGPGTTPTFTVTKGLFETKIMERGTLLAVRNVMITSQIGSDQAKILRLAPEGSYVKKGDLIVVFDKAPFERQSLEAQAELGRAQTGLSRAEEGLRAEKTRMEEDAKKAEDQLVLAELGLKDLLEGSGPLRIRRSKFEMEKSEREYKKLEQDFGEFKELVKEGYVSQVELDGIGRKRDEAQSALEFARDEYESLIKYTHPAALAAARSTMRVEKEYLEKQKEMTQYILASKDAELNRARADIRTSEAMVSISAEQLRHMEIHAPIEGFVIYSEVSLMNSPDRRKVRIGDAVFPTQPFMLIPDTSQMFVSSQIREVDIHKVKPGQEAIIRMDAYPDLVLRGHVSLLGTLAESKEREGIGGKYFNLEILLENTESRLRPGMTARLEILTDQEKDVLMVPVEAVFEKHGRKMVYVASGEKVEAREIVTDKSNEDYRVVREGLSEGNRVLLLDPTHKLDTFEKRSEPIPLTKPAAVPEKKKAEDKSGAAGAQPGVQ